MSEQDEQENRSRMKRVKVNKKALKRSFWGSLSRVIGVVLGASAGGLLRTAIGDDMATVGVGAGLAVLSFFLIWFSEYEREVE